MPGRNRAWSDTIYIGAQINDGAVDVKDLLVNAPTVDTLTAVRIVLDLELRHGSDEGADITSAVHVGIGVCSVEAFAVSEASALPSPAVATEYPPRGWLYANTQHCSESGGAGAVQVQKSAIFKADLRAMRKIDKGILFMVVENQAILGATAIDIWGRVRVLCLT